jgi:hypothetical protein
VLEANVLTFAGTNAFGSKNDAAKQNVPTAFGAGWLNLGFFPSTVTGTVHTLGNAATSITPIGSAPSAAGTYTYYGLPLIGFAAIGYQYGALPVTGGTALSNYGGAFAHKVTTRVSNTARLQLQERGASARRFSWRARIARARKLTRHGKSIDECDGGRPHATGGVKRTPPGGKSEQPARCDAVTQMPSVGRAGDGRCGLW